MDVLGDLLPGAGILTTFPENYVHQFLMLDTGAADPTLNGIEITVGGRSTQRINIAANTTIMQTFTQLVAREVLGIRANGQPNYIIPIGDGFNPEDKVIYGLINAGVATPTVRAFSINKGSRQYVKSGMQEINANSSQTYMKGQFDYLIFDPTNFDYADITFRDLHQEGKMDLEGMRALGFLGGPLPSAVDSTTVTIVDNSEGMIEAITLNAAAGGNLNVINVANPGM